MQLLVEQGIIEKFVPIDFSDADTVYDRCLAVSKHTCVLLGHSKAMIGQATDRHLNDVPR